MDTLFYADKIAVITGGTSGIGYAIAEELLKRGSRIYVIARNEGRMKEAVNTLQKNYGEERVFGIQADVSNEIEISRAIDYIGKEAQRIDLLVNSAGIMVCGRFLEIDSESSINAIMTNYIGCVNTCRAAWKYLPSNSGHIGIISSVAGYAGVIGYSAYSPSKFAVTGFAEALRMEAAMNAISVSVLFPPDTETPMLQYEEMHSIPESRALNKKMKIYTAEKVAQVYLEGIKRGKLEVYCDIQSQILRWFKTLFPVFFHKQAMKLIRGAI